MCSHKLVKLVVIFHTQSMTCSVDSTYCIKPSNAVTQISFSIEITKSHQKRFLHVSSISTDPSSMLSDLGASPTSSHQLHVWPAECPVPTGSKAATPLAFRSKAQGRAKDELRADSVRRKQSWASKTLGAKHLLSLFTIYFTKWNVAEKMTDSNAWSLIPHQGNKQKFY